MYHFPLCLYRRASVRLARDGGEDVHESRGLSFMFHRQRRIEEDLLLRQLLLSLDTSRKSYREPYVDLSNSDESSHSQNG